MHKSQHCPPSHHLVQRGLERPYTLPSSEQDLQSVRLMRMLCSVKKAAMSQVSFGKNAAGFPWRMLAGELYHVEPFLTHFEVSTRPEGNRTSKGTKGFSRCQSQTLTCVDVRCITYLAVNKVKVGRTPENRFYLPSTTSFVEFRTEA